MKFGKLKNGVAIVLASFLFVCLWIVLTPCQTDPSLLNAPTYIESLWPPAKSETLLGCYIKTYLLVAPSGTGVGLRIDTESIWKLEMGQSNNEVLPSFQDRVFLFVDGEQVPINRRAEGGGSWFTTVDGKSVDFELAGWYFFGSSRFMSLGDHLAKVVINTKSGKTLEYEWRFRIK